MKRVVYTGGTFDLFHAGHVTFLRAARALGDELVVAVNSDEFAGRYKRRPVMSYDERVYVLNACRFVDRVVLNVGDEDSGISIAQVCPQAIVIGDDWRNRDYLGQLGIDQAFLDALGATIIYLPYTQNVSTSDIIQRIQSR